MKKNKYIEALCSPGATQALVWVMFQLQVVVRGSCSALIMCPIRVYSAMGLVSLIFPTFKKYEVPKGEEYLPQWYGYISAGIILFCCVYMVMNSTCYDTGVTYVDPLITIDYITAVTLLLLMLERSRYAVNLASIIIALILIGYGLFGEMMPGLLVHSNMSLARLVGVQVLFITGVFSSPVSTACDTVFYFFLFGVFLTVTSVGRLFVNISTPFIRKANGGAGRAAIVISALFGTISDGAPGSIASVGVIMYEPMKQQDFRNRFTGSILVIGGIAKQLISPVVGTVVFIMVDMTGTSYPDITLAVIIPSFIFLAALYFLVDMYARKGKLAKPQIEATTYRKETMEDTHLLLSVVALTALIIRGGSMMRYCTYVTIALVALCMIRKDAQITLFDFIKALMATGEQAVIATVSRVLVGIVVGQITATGFGTRFSSMINALANSNLLFALITTMLMAFVLGISMSTSVAYIMSATLLCLSIIKSGMSVLAAHFFVFYFVDPSMITPPVMLSSFTTAGVVNDNIWKPSLSAFKYSFIIFLVPYTFIYSPAMLGIGAPLEPFQSGPACLVEAYGLSMGLIECGIGPMKMLERVLAIAASPCLIIPETVTDLIGVILMIGPLSLQIIQSKKEKWVTA